MKTAEDWGYEIASYCDDSFCFDQEGSESTIKQIQLDAMREGMRRAAEEAWTDSYIRERILSASEQLTEKDL